MSERRSCGDDDAVTRSSEWLYEQVSLKFISERLVISRMPVRLYHAHPVLKEEDSSVQGRKSYARSQRRKFVRNTFGRQLLLCFSWSLRCNNNNKQEESRDEHEWNFGANESSRAHNKLCSQEVLLAFCWKESSFDLSSVFWRRRRCLRAKKLQRKEEPSCWSCGVLLVFWS